MGQAVVDGDMCKMRPWGEGFKSHGKKNYCDKELKLIFHFFLIFLCYPNALFKHLTDAYANLQHYADTAKRRYVFLKRKMSKNLWNAIVMRLLHIFTRIKNIFTHASFNISITLQAIKPG